MRLLDAVPVIILATTRHVVSAQQCVLGAFTLEFEGACNYANVLAAYTAQVYEAIGNVDEATCAAGATAEEDLNAKLTASGTTVKAICEAAHDNVDITPYYEAARQGTDMHFEQMFYNGRSHWQEEVETLYESEEGTATSVLREDAKTVREFYEADARYGRVQWPNMLTNFDDATCGTNAAMCCWPKDRQANDGNGNCAKPYDINCVDKDPADNTNLCYVDMSRGNNSNEFGSDSGYAAFPGDNDGEGPIHCHGFAWDNNEYDSSALYKANNLFFVSMYDHMHQRGYVRNIPGAPMCACLEQMPIVSRSDCTEIQVLEEQYSLIFDGAAFTASQAKLEIKFNACAGRGGRNNDLWAYAARLYDEGRMEPAQFGQIGRILTNTDCDEAVSYEHNKLGLTRGYQQDTSMWTKVAGRDSLYEGHEYGNAAFNAALFEHSTGKILMRVCATCVESHQYIFYKRLTEFTNPDFHLLDNLLYRRDNGNGDNVWGEDFTLHSTYEDAVAGTNAWICPGNSYDYGEGFPGDCSQGGSEVRGQHSFFYYWGRSDVAWYVNKAEDDHIATFNAGKTRSSLETDLDIGNVVVAGRTLEDDEGTLYITASGYGLWQWGGGEDQFRFLSVPGTGDIQVDVHVSSFSNIRNDWGAAGIMIRADNDANSEFAFACLFARQGISFRGRRSKGGNSFRQGYEYKTNPFQTSAWLRLIKKMEMVEMYYSDDGVTWTLHEGMQILFPNDSFRVGLAMTSSSNDVSEGAFENFSISDYEFPTAAPSFSTAPTPWTPAVDIGDVNRPGEYTPPGANGFTYVRGAGSGLWGHHDKFFYYNMQRSADDDFAVTMLTENFDNGWQFSKGGIMIRESNADDAAHAFIGLTGWNQGVAFQSRPFAGAVTEHHSYNYVPSKKVYLKLSKSGSDITASFKHIDSTEWTVAGTVALTLTRSSIQYGIAVTSGDEAASWYSVLLQVAEYEVTP